MTQGLPFTILIVDDDLDDQQMIDEAFIEISYNTEVKKFLGGKALFRYLDKMEANMHPSLIVLDNSLPEMEASEVLSLLKANPRYQSIPVVIYTTGISPSKKQQLMSLGAYACYEKGNSMREIIQLAKKFQQLAQDAS